ncbi:MAG: hypothetical protein ACK6DZ_18645 [Acidobacteriota bacterium]|jgi:hypothetical protein
MRCAGWILLLAGGAWGQLPISFGVKAGYVGNAQPGSRIFPFKGGAYVEVKVPKLPRLEGGLMLERYETGGRALTVYQIPLLLKKRFGLAPAQPFLSGGVTLRRVPAFGENYPGLTVAAGLTLGLLPVKIEPELRLTRWLQSNYSPRGQQAELLIGFRF